MKSHPSRSCLMIKYRWKSRMSSHIFGSLIFLSLLFISGCASPPKPTAIPPNANPIGIIVNPVFVTLPIDDAASEFEFVQWLRSGGVRVEKDANGDDRIFDSPACRAILVRYRRMLHVRMDVIAQNVANADSTRDAQGANFPYRRKFVVADANGAVEIRLDPSPFQERYIPTHPDADNRGYVHFPNVELAVEYVDAYETSRLYGAVTRVLMHLDPTFVEVYSDVAKPGPPIEFHAPTSLPKN